MKINGKIYVTFEELAEALGLPDDIEVRLVSAEPLEVARGVFTVWFCDPETPELDEGCEAPVFAEFMRYKRETREARCEAIWRAVKFGGGGYRSEKLRADLAQLRQGR